jgi:hypothetical protein
MDSAGNFEGSKSVKVETLELGSNAF